MRTSEIIPVLCYLWIWSWLWQAESCLVPVSSNQAICTLLLTLLVQKWEHSQVAGIRWTQALYSSHADISGSQSRPLFPQPLDSGTFQVLSLHCSFLLFSWFFQSFLPGNCVSVSLASSTHTVPCVCLLALWLVSHGQKPSLPCSPLHPFS